MWQNRNLQRRTCHLMFRPVPHPRKVWLHAKVRGYSQLRGNTKAGWEETQNPTHRRVLKRDFVMHTLAVWWTRPRGNLSLQKRNQGMWIFPELKLGVRMYQGNRLLMKQLRENPTHPVNQTAREGQKLKGQIYTCLQLQPTTRKQHSRSLGTSTDENMKTLCIMTWICFFLVHKYHSSSSRSSLTSKMWIYDTWRIIFGTEKDGQLFRETGKLRSKRNQWFQDYWFPRCHVDQTSLLCENVYRFNNAKTCVFSDSVLCVGKWEMILLRPGRAKLNCIRKTTTSRIWIGSMECRRSSSGKFFPGIKALGLLEKIQKLLTDPQCEPEHFKGRIIFMSRYNDIEWGAKGNKERCVHNSKAVAECAREFPRGRWSFMEPGSENKWYGRYTNRLDGSWNQSPENMIWWQTSQDPVIQYFVHPAPLREEIYEAKEEARRQYTSMVVMKTSSSFSAQSFLRISSVSTEQYSNCATKYPKFSGLWGNLQHLIIWKRWKFLPTSLQQKIMPMHSNGETWCKNTNENSNNCQQTRNYPNYVLMRDWSLSNKDNTSLDTEGQQMQHLCQEYTMLRNEKGTRVRGWILKNTEFKCRLCFKTIPPLELESWPALTSTWQNRCSPIKKRTQLRRNSLLKQDHEKSPQ